MPLKIIRNDITKVKADVIVNTANPKATYGSGTDGAIYQAAGVTELLKRRKEIGSIERGHIAVTPAFALDAKYIIHTVGPIWEDGNHGELETLKSCYEKSLQKTLELGCKSVAFPLISTGVYGFPKDRALQIAVSVFSKFLMDNEIQIILVVFDKKAYQLSSSIVGEIEAFIDSNYVKKKSQSEYARNISNRSRRRLLLDLEEMSDDEAAEIRSVMLSEESMRCSEPLIPMEADYSLNLENELLNIGASFHDKLFEIIAREGIDNKDVWKNANLDRKHFSKIQCDVNYHPKKKTVLALCISLKLDLEETKDLLSRADWALSPSSKVDLIVQKAIIDKQYDINQINMVLFKYTNEILGV